MLTSKAFAAGETLNFDLDMESVGAVAAPSAGEAFIWNMGLVGVLCVMFYILLIRPQQKRFKEHAQMLSGLKKGDKVVTGGGLVGKIDKITEGNDEVVIDLGNGQKVTALRSTINAKNESVAKKSPAAAENDKAPAKKTAKKKK